MYGGVAFCSKVVRLESLFKKTDDRTFSLQHSFG